MVLLQLINVSDTGANFPTL